MQLEPRDCIITLMGFAYPVFGTNSHVVCCTQTKTTNISTNGAIKSASFSAVYKTIVTVARLFNKAASVIDWLLRISPQHWPS